MGCVVALNGEESKKIVDGVKQRVVPFVGADRKGESAQMGVGVILLDHTLLGRPTARIWGVMMPHNLIQSWRGMKILERVKKIDCGTLCACWYAGSRNIRESDKRYLDELAKKVGGANKLQVFRDEVLSSVPSPGELNTMITNLREKGVDVDSWELEEEVKAGRIAMSPLIETLVRRGKSAGRHISVRKKKSN